MKKWLQKYWKWMDTLFGIGIGGLAMFCVMMYVLLVRENVPTKELFDTLFQPVRVLFLAILAGFFYGWGSELASKQKVVRIRGGYDFFYQMRVVGPVLLSGFLISMGLVADIVIALIDAVKTVFA